MCFGGCIYPGGKMAVHDGESARVIPCEPYFEQVRGGSTYHEQSPAPFAWEGAGLVERSRAGGRHTCGRRRTTDQYWSEERTSPPLGVIRLRHVTTAMVSLMK